MVWTKEILHQLLGNLVAINIKPRYLQCNYQLVQDFFHPHHLDSKGLPRFEGSLLFCQPAALSGSIELSATTDVDESKPIDLLTL